MLVAARCDGAAFPNVTVPELATLESEMRTMWASSDGAQASQRSRRRVSPVALLV
jgi:hypothetical protein